MPEATPPKPERLQKYLAACGVGSRRTCEAIIKEGRVAVDGTTASLGMSITPGVSQVTVDGKPVGTEPLVYVLLYKPKGLVTSADDEYGRRTVLDAIVSALSTCAS